jgi:hypothetical protein
LDLVVITGQKDADPDMIYIYLQEFNYVLPPIPRSAMKYGAIDYLQKTWPDSPQGVTELEYDYLVDIFIVLIRADLTPNDRDWLDGIVLTYTPGAQQTATKSWCQDRQVPEYDYLYG